MRRNRAERIPEYLRDILGGIAQIQKHTASVTQDEFVSNDVIYEAVLFNFHVIGEASRRIQDADPDFIERHPDMGLREAHGVRNRVAHDYDKIDLDVVWNTVILSLPQLKIAIEKHLDD
jgi:uncharacterized protein with HEPN domain